MFNRASGGYLFWTVPKNTNEAGTISILVTGGNQNHSYECICLHKSMVAVF